jgi:hypothetical protein
VCFLPTLQVIPLNISYILYLRTRNLPVMLCSVLLALEDSPLGPGWGRFSRLGPNVLLEELEASPEVA